MLQRFLRFMQGRYGVDELSKFMIGSSFFLAILNIFVRTYVISAFLWIVMIWIYFRIFSKNKYKRYQENQFFLKYAIPVENAARKEINLLKLRKDFYIYKCPTCKQKIKIPRGKGKIAIRCPKCRNEFIKRS